jgi:ElaB/YqjD/DUF883 family membrane-anchored ribosome-binding protein
VGGRHSGRFCRAFGRRRRLEVNQHGETRPALGERQLLRLNMAATERLRVNRRSWAAKEATAILEKPTMPTDTLATDDAPPVEDAVAKAADAINAATEQGKQTLQDALAQAERTIADAVKAAERALRDGFEKLREQGKPIAENAGQQIDDAQRYMTGRVQERPMTAVLTGVGVGLVLGLLLSHRSQ